MNHESVADTFDVKRNRADSYAVTNTIPELD
jgi:hypothetical protein